MSLGQGWLVEEAFDIDLRIHILSICIVLSRPESIFLVRNTFHKGKSISIGKFEFIQERYDCKSSIENIRI